MIFKSTTCVNIVKGMTRFGDRLGELYKMYCFNIYIAKVHPYLHTWKGLQVRKHIHAAYFC